MLSRLLSFLFQPRSQEAAPSSTADQVAPKRPLWAPLDPRRPVLMLDVDGVLHPGDVETLEFKPLLYQILDLIPELQVVFSSNWQHDARHDWLVERFSYEYKHQFCGVTGPKLECEFPRRHEIERFAREHGLKCFVAVDDRPELFGPECPWLFVVPRSRGLDEGNHLALASFIQERMVATGCVQHSPWHLSPWMIEGNPLLTDPRIASALADIITAVADVAIHIRFGVRRNDSNWEKGPTGAKLSCVLADSLHNLNEISAAVQEGKREHAIYCCNFFLSYADMYHCWLDDIVRSDEIWAQRGAPNLQRLTYAVRTLKGALARTSDQRSPVALPLT